MEITVFFQQNYGSKKEQRKEFFQNKFREQKEEAEMIFEKWKQEQQHKPNSIAKAEQQKHKQEFFGERNKRTRRRQDRRDGGAGRALDGLTKTETGDQGAMEAYIKDQKWKWKKAQKRKRNKQNRKRKHHKNKKILQAKIVERRRFHIPKNVLKLKQKRCKRRREYRAYMRSRVSELRRKEEAKWLHKHPTKEKTNAA